MTRVYLFLSIWDSGKCSSVLKHIRLIFGNKNLLIDNSIQYSLEARMWKKYYKHYGQDPLKTLVLYIPISLVDWQSL